ncbi:SAP domain-containing protein [Biomaibacter acetigenes]|nr:SAP domain-containing protein [Biomaibacter acetigenes]
MSILDFFKNMVNTSSKSKINTNRQNKREIKSIHDFSNAEIELLKYMDNKPLTFDIPAYWNEKVNDPKQFIELCISKKYVNDQNIEGSLMRLTIAELKKILDMYGLPKKGKKGDLVKTIKENLSLEQIKKYPDFKLYYSLSDELRTRIDNYLKEKEENFNKMFDDIVKFIKEGNIDAAIERYFNYERSLVFVPSSGPFFSEQQKRSFDIAFNELSYSDVVNTEEYINILKAVIIACMITGIDYMRKNIVVDYINNNTNEIFNCPKLKEYLMDTYNYLGDEFFAIDKNNPAAEAMLKIYIHTKSSEAMNKAVYYEVVESDDPYIIGIEILPPNNPDDMCKICKRKKKIYKKSEFDKLPKIPAHYGCRCSYLKKYKPLG